MLVSVFLRGIYWSGRCLAAGWRRVAWRISTAMHRATLDALGKGSRIDPGVRFAQPGLVSIGTGCHIATGCQVSAEVPGEGLVIADWVQINRFVHLDTTGGLVLGTGVLISEGAVLYTHDHGLDPRSRPLSMRKTVGADVWIGMRAVVLPGCRQIGRGAVIGAGAIVVHDVPEGAIVAGNPARVIGQRPSKVRIVA